LADDPEVNWMDFDVEICGPVSATMQNYKAWSLVGVPHMIPHRRITSQTPFRGRKANGHLLMLMACFKCGCS
jgi:hypothetical protein